MYKMFTMKKRILSVILVLAMMMTMIVPAMTLTVSAAPADEDNYYALVGRLENARNSLIWAAETNGVIDLRNGYELDIASEMLAFAANIDIDLGVAAALAAGNRVDDNYGALKHTGGTDNSANFTAFLNKFGGSYGAAVEYLKRGGIAEQQWGVISVTWFYWFGSAMNPTFSASSSVLGVNRNNQLPVGTTLADIAENYATDLLNTVGKLTAAINQLESYSALADGIYDYLKTQDCLIENCDEDCDDWTHRLLEGVSETVYTNAVNNFKNGLDHDIKVLGDLATGSIDSGLWAANNTNSKTYYNNTIAPSTIDKLNAALSFLDKGGYNCGTASFWSTNNQLSYKSSFTNYKVAMNLVGAGFDVSGEEEVFPIVEFQLGMLQIGATADDVDLIYNLKVKQVNDYIDAANELPATVPAGAKYTQEEYTAAIGKFIANANRDLYIAAFLVSGAIDMSYGTAMGNPSYTTNSKERYANAIKFFAEGGCEYGTQLFGIGVYATFKSSFHPDYSSGLFGMAANKAKVLNIMSDTLNALKLGYPYMTPKELAELRYNDVRTKLLDIADNPSSVVETILSSDQDLSEFFDTLSTLLGSLDDIINIVDILSSNDGIAGIVDPLLGQMGLSLDLLKQLAGLKDILDNLGFDTSSGDITSGIGALVSGGIKLAVGTTDLGVLLGTESAYNVAAATLETTYNGIMDNATDALLAIFNYQIGETSLGSLLKQISPYLGMLSSGISLINRVMTLINQIGTLTSDFSAGNIGDTIFTLSYICDDLAKFLTDFGDAELLNSLLGGLLGGGTGNMGGLISNGLAGLLNNTVNGLVGSDLLNVSGDSLGVIGDTVSNLISNGLSNPKALVPLLEATAEILRNVGRLSYGIDDLLKGDYSTILNTLITEVPGLFINGIDLISALLGLFSSTPAAAAAPMSALAADLDLDPGDEEMIGIVASSFSFDFGSAIYLEAQDTALALCDPNTSYNAKLAKYNEFKNYLCGIKDCLNDICQAIKCIENAKSWACENMTKEAAKECIEEIIRAYLKELCGCLKDKIKCSNIIQVKSKIKDCFSKVVNMINCKMNYISAIRDKINELKELCDKNWCCGENCGVGCCGCYCDLNIKGITRDKVLEELYEIKAFLECLDEHSCKDLKCLIECVQDKIDCLEHVCITFDANGGIFDDGDLIKPIPATLMDKSSDYVPTEPTKIGYKFVGWFDSPENGSSIDEYPDIYRCFKFYAQWEPVHACVTYYDGVTILYKYDDVYNGFLKDYVPAPNPTKDGYNFIGWFDKIEGGSSIDAYINNIIYVCYEFYARWEKIDEPGPKPRPNPPPPLPGPEGEDITYPVYTGDTTVVETTPVVTDNTPPVEELFVGPIQEPAAPVVNNIPEELFVGPVVNDAVIGDNSTPLSNFDGGSEGVVTPPALPESEEVFETVPDAPEVPLVDFVSDTAAPEAPKDNPKTGDLAMMSMIILGILSLAATGIFITKKAKITVKTK